MLCLRCQALSLTTRLTAALLGEVEQSEEGRPAELPQGFSIYHYVDFGPSPDFLAALSKEDFRIQRQTIETTHDGERHVSTIAWAEYRDEKGRWRPHQRTVSRRSASERNSEPAAGRKLAEPAACGRRASERSARTRLVTAQDRRRSLRSLEAGRRRAQHRAEDRRKLGARGTSQRRPLAAAVR